MRFTHLSAITSGLEAVATILSAIKVITFSIRSLAAASQNDSQENHETKGEPDVGVHKWILIAGAVVGVITIAYLENIATNCRSKQTTKEEKPRERVEPVYVTE
jgi:hypothetical protein